MTKRAKQKFIKNVLTVDVDGLRAENRYIVKAMYDEIDEEGFAEIKFKIIEDFTLTWAEIQLEGGVEQVTKDLKECYDL